MPDFEVNEGYVEAGRRRADSPLSSRGGEDRVPADGYVPAEEGGVAPAPVIRVEATDAVDAVEGRRKLPEETPIVRRTRHLAAGHFSASGAPLPRVGVKLIARRRRLARRACPYGWQVRVLGTAPRNRRRLWTHVPRITGIPELTCRPCAISTCAWCSRRPRSCWSRVCRCSATSSGACAWLLTRAGMVVRCRSAPLRAADPKRQSRTAGGRR